MLYRSFNDIAMEESNSTPDPKVKLAEIDESANENKPSSSPTESEAKPTYQEAKKKKSVIAEILEAMIELVGRLFTNLGGRIDALYSMDDESFLTKYNQAKKNYKPDLPLRKETTRCNSKPVDAGLNLVRAFTEKAINECRSHVYGSKLDENSIFEMSKEDFNKAFLKYMNAPDRFTVPSQYFEYLKEVCKGEKGIITITEDQLNGYENIACLRSDALKSKLRADESKMNKLVNQCRANFRLVSNAAGNSAEIADRAIKYSKRLNDVLKLYIDYMKLYNEVKLNKINTARSVLRAVYKI